MYKSAGFENTDESRKEAMKRMIDGEVFHLKTGGLLYYCKEAALDGEPCFLLNNSDNPIIGWWSMMKQWQIKANWHDSITKPVPCRVGHNKELNGGIDLISRYVTGASSPFIGHRMDWPYAEPLTCSELLESMEKDNG